MTLGEGRKKGGRVSKKEGREEKGTKTAGGS